MAAFIADYSYVLKFLDDTSATEYMCNVYTDNWHIQIIICPLFQILNLYDFP
jgi:hypothetical protein